LHKSSNLPACVLFTHRYRNTVSFFNQQQIYLCAVIDMTDTEVCRTAENTVDVQCKYHGLPLDTLKLYEKQKHIYVLPTCIVFWRKNGSVPIVCDYNYSPLSTDMLTYNYYRWFDRKKFYSCTEHMQMAVAVLFVIFFFNVKCFTMILNFFFFLKKKIVSKYLHFIKTFSL